MNPEEAFLADILENPEDDAPRLVYADWLDEHGEGERAEFIRTQIELARLGEDHPRRAELAAVEEVLLRDYGEAWLGPLAEFVSEPTFRRGFVESANVGVRQFLSNGTLLFSLTPLRHVKLLRLTQAHITPAELAACPHLARLRGLDLQGSMVGDEVLAELLASPHLVNVEELQLRNTQAGPRALAALRTGGLKRLKVLNLSSCALRAGLHELTADTPPFRLEVLALSDNALDNDQVRELGAWPGLASVRELDLGYNLLRVPGGQALAAAPFVGSLRTLDVHGCAIGAGGMRALCESPGLAGLTTLRLGGNTIGRKGVEALVGSASLANLCGLYLNTNNIGDHGARLLAGWPGLAGHPVLQLRNNAISPAGAVALLTSPHLGELTELDLGDNPIGDEAVQALVSCPRLGGLVRLGLGNCGIGSGWLGALARRFAGVRNFSLYA
jgi:uncharacterized protein (TIGR02996 family)